MHVQLEKLAVLQHKNELQLQEEHYQLRVGQLQASLQEANDQCGKIRLQYERYCFDFALAAQ